MPNLLTTALRALRYPSAANNGAEFAEGLENLADDVDSALPWGGACIIPGEESRTNTAYGTLATPDVVEGIVLPTNGLLFFAYQAMFKSSSAASGYAAPFLGANQVKLANIAAAPGVQEARTTNVNDAYSALFSGPAGLVARTDSSPAGVTYSGDVTTGQLIGAAVTASGTTQQMEIFAGGNTAAMAEPLAYGGLGVIFADAGTYDFSIQFKASSGSVTAKERKLWVWTQPFPGF